MKVPTSGFAAIALAALVSACHPVFAPTKPGLAVADAAPVPPLTHSRAVLHAHLASAFVVPLLDDDEPPRFTDLHRALLCADRSQVTVDGRPVIPGDLVPPGAFVLHWDVEMYCPFGHGGPVVDGRADVLVFRDDEQGLTAILRADTLQVHAPALPFDEPVVRTADVAPDAVQPVAAR